MGGFPISREKCSSTLRADSKLIPKDVFAATYASITSRTLIQVPQIKVGDLP